VIGERRHCTAIVSSAESIKRPVGQDGSLVPEEPDSLTTAGSTSWTLGLLLAATPPAAAADGTEIDHLIDRIGGARVRSPLLDAIAPPQQVAALTALDCEGELPNGGGRVYVLPIPVDRERPLALEPAGPPIRLIAGTRFVGCDRQVAFAGLARKLAPDGRSAAIVDRPRTLELTVDRFGSSATFSLVGANPPFDDGAAPFVAHVGSHVIELRPLASATGFVASIELPDARGLQRIAVEVKSAGDGPRAWEFLGYELVESRGLDRVVVGSDVDPARTSLRYTPAAPAPVARLPAGDAGERVHHVVLARGSVALRGGNLADVELDVAGHRLAPSSDSIAGELRFEVAEPDVAELRGAVRGSASDPVPLLLQPAARWLRPHSLQRGVGVAEPRHPLVDHATAGHDTRRVLLLPPPSELRFALAGGERELLLDLAAVRTTTAPIELDPPALAVFLAAADGSERLLATWSAPLPGPELGALQPTSWSPHAIDLAAADAASPSDGALELVLRVAPSAKTPVASGLAALLVAEPRLVRRAARPRPPNLVIYLVDTLRADRLHALGNARATSPSFDAFAAEGLLFTHARSQAPWTRPAIATLFTGLVPEYHGITAATGLAPGLTTLAERMRAAGFATAAFTANAEIFAAGLDFEQGFDRFEAAVVPDRLPRSEHVVEPALAWLEENRDRPFFLFVHPIDPHDPYDPPAATAGRFERPYSGRVESGRVSLADLRGLLPLSEPERDHVVDLYDEEVCYADLWFGRFLQRLRELGRYDDTVVLFLADHGEELLDHGALGHVRRLWDEVLHVPMALKLAPRDSRPPPQGVVDGVVRTMDWLPTFAALFDLAPPAEGFQGVDLAPLWSGGTLPPLEAASQDFPRQSALVADGWKLIELVDRAGQHPSVRLFDLSEDPLERTDLAASRPEIVASLRSRLAALRREWDARGFVPVNAPRTETTDPDALRALRQLGYVQSR
jgi:arylsulfatase